MQDTHDIWFEALDGYIVDLKLRLSRVREYALDMPHHPMTEKPDSLHRLFREVHSLKGDASIMGVVEVSAMAHEMEETLVAIRDQGASFGGDEKSALLLAIERVSSQAPMVLRKMKDERKQEFKCPEK